MKTCLECNDKLLGRSDKKFCSDSCRSAYHNQKKHVVGDVARYQLMINHRLLNFLFATRKNRDEQLAIQPLISLGFNPNVYTSCYQQNGIEYRYCYEYAFSVVDGELKLVG